MKRILIIALLICALAAVLCVAAYATSDPPSVSGIYWESALPNGIMPCTATSLDAIDAVDAIINNENVKFYPGAQRITVQIAPDAPYALILMQDSTETKKETIRYIDQAAKENGYITFTVYPDALKPNTTYYIYTAYEGSQGKQLLAQFMQYEYVPYKLGDVDGDKEVTSDDALMALQAVVGLVHLDETQTLAAEVDHDGEVTSDDALMILQSVVGLVELT